MIIYNASGGIRVVGCAGVGLTGAYFVRYGLGSKVYVKKKALRGVLEPVVIKKINRVGLTRPFSHGVGAVINYVDTTNRVWIEDELVSQQTAVDMAIIHWENIKQEGSQILQENGCLPMPPEGCRSGF